MHSHTSVPNRWSDQPDDEDDEVDIYFFHIPISQWRRFIWSNKIAVKLVQFLFAFYKYLIHCWTHNASYPLYTKKIFFFFQNSVVYIRYIPNASSNASVYTEIFFLKWNRSMKSNRLIQRKKKAIHSTKWSV